MTTTDVYIVTFLPLFSDCFVLEGCVQACVQPKDAIHHCNIQECFRRHLQRLRLQFRFHDTSMTLMYSRFEKTKKTKTKWERQTETGAKVKDRWQINIQKETPKHLTHRTIEPKMESIRPSPPFFFLSCFLRITIQILQYTHTSFNPDVGHFTQKFKKKWCSIFLFFWIYRLDHSNISFLHQYAESNKSIGFKHFFSLCNELSSKTIDTFLCFCTREN